jgi:hypothetical protein
MLRFTSILWTLLPKLRFVQFPWRWMSIVAIPFVYFLTAAVARRRFRWLFVAATLSLLAGTGVYLVQHTWWDKEDFPTLRAAIDAGGGFDGTDEYDPIGDDHYNLPQKALAAQLVSIRDNSDAGTPQPPLDSKVFVDRWTADEKVVRVTSSQPSRLALRLLNYPAWQVEVNGAPIQPQHPDDSGQMLVPVPVGKSRISAQFARTPDRTLGGILSLMSLFAVVFLLIWDRRARRQ